MITRENWPEDWSEVAPFTPVSEEVYNHFLNVLPPVRFSRNLLQAGGAYNHDIHGALFITFYRFKDQWYFVGFYHAGEILPVERKIVYEQNERSTDKGGSEV